MGDEPKRHLKLERTGETVRVLCSGEGHPQCRCYSANLPRDIPTYRSKIGDDLAEVYMLCDPCRTRLEKEGEITVADPQVEGNTSLG